MARGVGGGEIIRGRRLVQIFPSKRGDYSREAINRGKAIIRGNTVKTNCIKFCHIYISIVALLGKNSDEWHTVHMTQ